MELCSQVQYGIQNLYNAAVEDVAVDGQNIPEGNIQVVPGPVTVRISEGVGFHGKSSAGADVDANHSVQNVVDDDVLGLSRDIGFGPHVNRGEDDRRDRVQGQGNVHGG
eukprot:TRINITY_DN16705_c0_g1::TRINITY_DN16705_c0_g1_i1::g.23599::m.23599 TRINITY_DN16705_c0_g1::TRINITY_DN16705_c0_g1_i1::g.23599  ORF type:complete len:109 (+),score=16.11 TRINITY_DN16705_c0_g1_i1:182-508(+)